MMNIQRKQQFTLIELLVVLSVIMILFSLLIGVLDETRKTLKSVQCVNNIKQLNVCTALYVSDYDNNLPAAALSRGSDKMLATVRFQEAGYLTDIDRYASFSTRRENGDVRDCTSLGEAINLSPNSSRYGDAPPLNEALFSSYGHAGFILGRGYYDENKALPKITQLSDMSSGVTFIDAFIAYNYPRNGYINFAYWGLSHWESSVAPYAAARHSADSINTGFLDGHVSPMDLYDQSEDKLTKMFPGRFWR